MFTVENQTNTSENALIIGVNDNTCSESEFNEQLLELKLLAETAGAVVVSESVQKRSKIDPATHIGKGKATSVIEQAKELKCNLIIFNDDLGPTQLKNLQKLASEEIKILDRTGLILDIFKKHAQTKEAKTQVKLAHLEYLLPRLTRQWTHLERQMGGIGTRGGPGETQIEIDRRLIRNQITKLKNELIKIQKHQQTQSQSRANLFRIALVGYTNAGKSTIMQALTNADVFIQDQLFATLDTTTRKLNNFNGVSVVLSDTVGFIRKLPHDLVASFRSTLSVANDADLLLKVVDASSLFAKTHMQTIDSVLKELNIESKKELLIFNKIDLIQDQSTIKGLTKSFPDAIFISAQRKLKIDGLLSKIKECIETKFIEKTILIPHTKGALITQFYKKVKVESRIDEYDGVKLKIKGLKPTIESLLKKIMED